MLSTIIDDNILEVLYLAPIDSGMQRGLNINAACVHQNAFLFIQVLEWQKDPEGVPLHC